VAQGLSDFEAKVMTARLGADGILWEVRGVMGGVYPLGGIDILVPVDELAAARVSLRGAGGQPVPADEEPGLPPPTDEEAGSAGASGGSGDREPEEVRGPNPGAAGPAGRRRWLTVMLVAAVAAFALARLASAVILYDVRTDCDGDSFRAAAEGLTVRCRP
jgi:hypothetical protein